MPPSTPSSADETLFSTSLLLLFISIPSTFLPLLFVAAPYGKHSRPNWGPLLPAPLSWLLMESPALLLPLPLLPLGRHRSNPFSLLAPSLFLLHYLNRTLLHPLRLRRAAARPVPASIVAMGFAFNVLNAYLQARSATHYADYGGRVWRAGVWTWGRVGAGAGVFAWGMRVNVGADRVLMGMRRGGDGGYGVPRGGWFEAVSCANYMGEMAEWLGWAVVAWSPAAVGFWLYTVANLLPRAMSYHRWYKEKFGAEYPPERKAVLPYIL